MSLPFCDAGVFRLVIAYSVGTSVEYFAFVESQYWSNLGLNLTVNYCFDSMYCSPPRPTRRQVNGYGQRWCHLHYALCLGNLCCKYRHDIAVPVDCIVLAVTLYLTRVASSLFCQISLTRDRVWSQKRPLFYYLQVARALFNCSFWRRPTSMQWPRRRKASITAAVPKQASWRSLCIRYCSRIFMLPTIACRRINRFLKFIAIAHLCSLPYFLKHPPKMHRRMLQFRIHLHQT